MTATIGTEPLPDAIGLTRSGVAVGCVVAVAYQRHIPADAKALSEDLTAKLLGDEPCRDPGALLPDVRRLRALIGEHSFGEAFERDALPWFEAQATTRTA